MLDFRLYPNNSLVILPSYALNSAAELEKTSFLGLFPD